MIHRKYQFRFLLKFNEITAWSFLSGFSFRIFLNSNWNFILVNACFTLGKEWNCCWKNFTRFWIRSDSHLKYDEALTKSDCNDAGHQQSVSKILTQNVTEIGHLANRYRTFWWKTGCKFSLGDFCNQHCRYTVTKHQNQSARRGLVKLSLKT